MTAEHDKKRIAQHVDRLMDRLKAAERERDELRADADRYRWVREKAPGEICFDQTHDKSAAGDHFALRIPFDGEPIETDAECSSRMDAAIDAARAQADKCSCDQRGIGAPGVTCGDCPRDYGSKA